VERPPRPILVVSDTHLGPERPAALARDLARVLSNRPGYEIVLAGDVFDLSFAPCAAQSSTLLSSLLDRASEVVRVLHSHVSRGDPLTIIPGNHDLALARDGVQRLFTGRLELQAQAPVKVERWFIRRGEAHIEHGHVYDPDNAPIHPLVEWNDQTEPLGIALTRRFVAATGAGYFTHAHDTTPVQALASAFRIYRQRAPLMIAQYFQTAIQLCLEAGPRRRADSDREQSLGETRIREFAAENGMAETSVRNLIAQTARPTHLDAHAVFLRLYFDRVLAALLLGSSLAALPKLPLAAVPALGSLAYIAGSVARGKDRSAGMPQRGLREAAGRVRELGGAGLVVFGHTHLEDEHDGYINTGSFAYPRQPGRPYLTIDSHGRAERARLLASA
jgi:UDP-2,3-diacylglucosamine pyrophosphatase LpxH